MVIISSVLQLSALAGLVLVTVSGSIPWAVVVLWGMAGGGIGLIYPRLNVLTLAYSTPSNEGFNSSALSIADSTGSAVTIALAGMMFVTLPVAGSGFAVVFALAALVLVIATLPGSRLGDGPGAAAALTGESSPDPRRG